MINRYVIITTIILGSILNTAPVTSEEAVKVAGNLLSIKINEDDLKLHSIEIIKDGATDCIYIINFKNNGFVMVSGDNRLYPVLGYSDKNHFSYNNLPIQLKDMLEFYKQQISYVIENDSPSNVTIDNLWEYYLSDNLIPQETRNVQPLFSFNWDQVILGMIIVQLIIKVQVEMLTQDVLQLLLLWL